MQRKALADKILVLGIDGMDPRLTCKYVAEGKMPNTKAFIERCAQREDLVMLGGQPTVTPSMWTTLALHNRDAVLLGMGGPYSGDILYWMAEGYNYDHCDSLSTTFGYGETSVSPIFIAAGKGLKQGYKTDRIIREVDVAPTVAALGGVRIPRQCEGAPSTKGKTPR